MIEQWRAACAALGSVLVGGALAVAGASPAAAGPAGRAPAVGVSCRLSLAPTSARARTLARLCAHPVEVAAERTGRTRVVANPDGTATLRAFAVDTGVQPNSQTAGRNRWAYADSSNSNNNDGVARVGVDPGGSGTYRSYFEFPVAAAAGSRIIAASVNTTMIHSWSCDSTPVTLWWSAPIPAGVNGTRLGWAGPGLNTPALDQRSGHAHKPSGGAGCGNDPQPDMPIQFTGQTLLQKEQLWADQRVAAVTMALTAADPSGANEGDGHRWKKFSVSSTVLVVQYNFPPATPGAAALSAVGTSQAVGCWTGEAAGQPRVNATGGLHLRATLTDADAGDNVLARFEWQDVTGGAVVVVPDTPAFPSGHTYDVTLPASALPDGQAIQWRVHGWDGRDNGGTSAWCQLSIDNATPGQPALATDDLPPYPGAPAAAVTVGTPVAVTATPADGDADIRGYYVGVGSVETTPTTWVPAGPGGVATIAVVPVVSGIAKNFLTVIAVDAAGNRSPTPLSAPDAPGSRQFRANPATGARTRGDVTGDGLADFAGLSDAGNGQTALVNLDTGAGGSSTLPPAMPITTDPGAFPVTRLVPVRGDFNGDGRSDIAAFRDEGSCRTTLWWWVSTGNGYVPSNTLLWDGKPNNWCLANATKVVAGDLTGDGRDDVGAFYSYPNNQVKLWVWPGRADGTGFDAPTLWWDSGAGNWEYSHFQAAAADIDGDGDDDIVQLYDYNSCATGLIVFTSNRAGITSAIRTWKSANNEFCWTRLSKPLVGDLDGDGRADVTGLYDLGNGSWEPITLYGSAPNAVHVTAAHTLTRPGQIKPVMADFTGDGQPDIGLLSNDGANATSVWVAAQSGAADHAFAPEVRRWDSSTLAGGFSWTAFTPL